MQAAVQSLIIYMSSFATLCPKWPDERPQGSEVAKALALATRFRSRPAPMEEVEREGGATTEVTVEGLADYRGRSRWCDYRGR